jgi:dTDP-4-amino-4,6-dideoxygalactose transaminase
LVKGVEEKKTICEYVDEGGWLNYFKKTSLFENMIAEYSGAEHYIVVNNAYYYSGKCDKKML